MTVFTNSDILAWMSYFADHAPVSLEKVKVLNITGKNKNLIPTVESHKAVLVLTDAGHQDIFYSMWNAGLGDCEIWYNEGSQPEGEMKHDLLSNMINRGINASAGMLILNPNARSHYKIGMDNQDFSVGSVRYVGREIRAVIMNKLHVDTQDVLCVISGESIAVEAALAASEGRVIAVEYNRSDKNLMEENIHKFGLHNVDIIDSMEPAALSAVAVPDLAFIVAGDHLELEIASLRGRNPKMRFVIYTLELNMLASIPNLLEKYGLEMDEAVQVSVSKLNKKNMFVAQPSPWIISASPKE